MSDTPELTPPDPVSSEPTPPDLPPPRRSRRWLKWLLRIGAGLGTVVVVGGVVFVVWGDRIVTELLLPRVASSIDKAIKRPAELGDVEGFSFWGVKLGKTVIPPTDTDQTSITVDEIEVTIGLRSLIFQQTLKSNVVLTRPNVTLVQAEDGEWTDLRLPEASEAERRVELEIQSIKIEDAQVTAIPYVEEGSEAIVARQPIAADETDALIEFFGENGEEISFELEGNVRGDGEDGGFDINGEANQETQAIKANVQVHDLPAAGANLFLPDSLGLSSGVLDANLTAAAALTEDGELNESAVDVKGTARFQEGEFWASALPAPVRDVQSQLLFQGQRVTVEDTSLQLNDILLTAAGDVDWKEGYDLTAQIPAITVFQAQALGDFDLPVVVDGAFQLNVALVGELEKPTVQGQLASLQPVLIDQLSLDSVTADFGLTEYVDGAALPTRFSLNELRVLPTAGGVVVARGQADITDLENPQFQLVADADVPADSFAAIYGIDVPEDIVIGNLTAEVQAGGTLRSQTALAQWQLSEGTFPGTGELTLLDNVVALDNTQLQVGGGSAIAQAVLQLDSGNWQADIATTAVAVDQFTSQLSGLLSANVSAAGNLDALNLESIQAEGTAFIADAQVRLTEASDRLLERGDWTTAFVWGGDRINVASFTAPGIQANGTIGVDLSKPKLIDGLDLTVALRDFDLQPLNSFAPATVADYGQLTGFANFDGQLFGTLENPQIVGDARVNELAVNELIFEPLSGPVAFALAEGGRIDLRGQQDRLQVALRDTPGEQLPYWPVSFNVQNQEFVATGYTEGRVIHADIGQLPLSALSVRPAPQYGFGTAAGLLNASVEINLANFNSPTAEGTLTVIDPSLSPAEAESLTASFAYANDVATIRQGELRFDESRYLLAGQADLSAGLAGVVYDGTLTIAEGHIDEILPIVQQLNLSAFGLGDAPTLGSAADLATRPVGLPPETFAERLDSFVAFVEANPPAENEPGDWVLPALEELEGTFTGVIEVAGRSLDPANLTADFSLQGDSWQWGQYDEPNQFVLSGEVAQNSVAIETAFINAGDTKIELTGSGNLDRLDGQLTVDSLPVELAELIYPLPAEVTGELTLVTTFDGSLANPVVRGEASVADARVNGYSLEQVSADFIYRDAIARLAGEVAVESADSPITLTGTIPYALPFTTVRPRTNQLALTAVAANDNFEIVNALTNNRVRWQSGQGEVVVEVGGTLAQPQVNGQASFRDAAILSPQLRDPVTDLNGDVQFTLTQVEIQQLRANVGDGWVAVSGSLPLLASGDPIFSAGQINSQLTGQRKQSQPSPPQNGLLVSINSVPVDYDGLLQAEFAGQMLVTGALLDPTVSGNVAINDGQIQANQLLRQAGSLNLPTSEEVAEISPYRARYLGIDPLAAQPAEQTQGLLERVTLQNFGLTLGDRLTVSGSPFYNINAIGSLQVNGSLADLQPTGTIELASGWISLFSTEFRLDRSAPNTATFTGGLDPFVDVVMQARVQDVDITPAPTAPGGFANADVNESQIDAIGNVEYVRVQAVAQGPASELSDSLVLTSNSTYSQGELLALIGSNVFSDVTGASYLQAAEFLGAGSLTGLGDRIAEAVGLNYFSVFPTTDTGDEGASGLGIGVEASASISDRIDVDFFQVLNSNRPPQLGLQYRMTDELQLRGASNLDETEFELEYRIQF